LAELDRNRRRRRSAPFKKEIMDWLAAPIEWEEDMPDNASAQGSAKRFFEHEDLAILDKLGVEIVEGESPNSTCYAAELNKEVEEANEIAQKLGLSYRFREDSDDPDPPGQVMTPADADRMAASIAATYPELVKKSQDGNDT
jgi:hypothetical protein